MELSKFIKMLYLCPAFKALTHGVMVTHLFLVQAFKVRALVGQQKGASHEALFLFGESPKSSLPCWKYTVCPENRLPILFLLLIY